MLPPRLAGPPDRHGAFNMNARKRPVRTIASAGNTSPAGRLAEVGMFATLRVQALGYGPPDDRNGPLSEVDPVLHAFEVRHGWPLRPSQNRRYRQKRKQRKKRQEHKRGPKHISEKVGHLHSALLGNGVNHKIWRIADIG